MFTAIVSIKSRDLWKDSSLWKLHFITFFHKSSYFDLLRRIFRGRFAQLLIQRSMLPEGFDLTRITWIIKCNFNTCPPLNTAFQLIIQISEIVVSIPVTISFYWYCFYAQSFFRFATTFCPFPSWGLSEKHCLWSMWMSKFINFSSVSKVDIFIFLFDITLRLF